MIDKKNIGSGDGAGTEGSPKPKVQCPMSGCGDGESDLGATGSPSSAAKASADAEPMADGLEDGQSGVAMGSPNAAVSKIPEPRKKRAKSKISENEPDERISTDSLIRKVRDNSTWNQLVPEQLERLDGWLFDENLGYAKTAARVQKEFGIKATIASVGRYYRRRARVRQAEELVEAQLAAEGLNGLGVDANTLRAAVLKLVGKAALNLASEKPEELEQLASLSQILLDAEQNDLRRGRLELAERCFDYERTVESLDDMPQFRAYLEAIWDNKRLSHDQKVRRVKAFLFHWEKAVRKEEKIRNGK